MRPGRYLSDSEKKTILERYAAGDLSKDIAATSAININTIPRVVRELGGIVRPLGRQWKGDSHVDKNGYRWVSPGNQLNPIFRPMLYENGFVLEHRFVVAIALGRALMPAETVHHIDGNRANNHLSNLQLRQGPHGRGIAMCCFNCGSTLVGPVALSENQE